MSGSAAMIASVDGVVAVIGLDSLVLEVGGIGYRVFAAPRVIASARPGGRLKLFTHHLVREDRQALFGFAHARGARLLRPAPDGDRASGRRSPWPSSAAAPVPDLQLAILQQDEAVLVAIPGIGKKLAERVIFELKEKVAAAGRRPSRRVGGTGGRRDGGRRRAPGARLHARARRARRRGPRSPTRPSAAPSRTASRPPSGRSCVRDVDARLPTGPAVTRHASGRSLRTCSIEHPCDLASDLLDSRR